MMAREIVVGGGGSVGGGGGSSGPSNQSILNWVNNLADVLNGLTRLRTDIQRAREDEARLAAISQNTALTREMQDEYDRLVAEGTTAINQRYEDDLQRATLELEEEKKAAIAEHERITREWNTRRDNEIAWARAKYDAQQRNSYPFAGKFLPVSLEGSGDTIDVLDIINPAGPIGYYGNYAVYYMKPELESTGIRKVLTILKTPYLLYTDADHEPELVDPYLKDLTQRYGNITPEMMERDDIVDYVPDLRLRLAEIEAELREPQRLGDEPPPSPADFFADDELFRSFYPEYLFRKDLTRRFPVDTNNLVLDIEVGRGSVLEDFKKAHRGIDVLKAREEQRRLELDNERLRALLAESKLDARYWPEAQKFISLNTSGDGASQFGVGVKAGGEKEASEVFPIMEMGHNPLVESAASQTGIVYGTVEEAETHQPIVDANVQIVVEAKNLGDVSSSLPAFLDGGSTSAGGKFWFELPLGAYRVIAAASGHTPAVLRVDLRKGPQAVALKLSEQIPARGYIANAGSKEIHRPDCPWVALIDEGRLIKFGTLKEAQNKGYDRCSHCLGM